MSDLILKCEGVGKRYRDGSLDVQVLRGLDLEIHAGESTGIIGSSGSGKSTLLHILGGLDMPSEGRVLLMNEDLRTLSQRQLLPWVCVSVPPPSAGVFCTGKCDDAFADWQKKP